MIDAIAKAQVSGTVADHFDAPVLLGLILSIAAMWETHSPDFARRRPCVRSQAAPQDYSRRRRAPDYPLRFIAR